MPQLWRGIHCRELRGLRNTLNEERTIEWNTRHEKTPKLALVALPSRVPQTAECRVVRTGWARSPKWGASMWDTALNEFKSQIKVLFQVGAAEPAKKMSASRMLKFLKAMNPHCYDVPTENQILSLLAYCFAQKSIQRSEPSTAQSPRPNASTNNGAQLQVRDEYVFSVMNGYHVGNLEPDEVDCAGGSATKMQRKDSGPMEVQIESYDDKGDKRMEDCADRSVVELTVQDVGIIEQVGADLKGRQYSNGEGCP